MRILDRYILRSVLTIFISCLFVFLFLYVIIDLLSQLEDIIKHKAAFTLLVSYYLTYLPLMFVQISPFACLLSTLYTFGRLNHNNEIIAMRSSGMSVFEITKTAIIFGAIISLSVFWISDRVVPYSLTLNHRIKEQMKEENKTKAKKQEIIKNLAVYGSKNRLYFVNKFNPAAKTMEGITILEQDEHQNITKKIVANKGIYEDSVWKFYQSITYHFDKDGQIVEEPEYYDEELMNIQETPENFASQRQLPEFMSISQLQDYTWRLSKSGATSVVRSLDVDLYRRFTSPFTSFVIVFLGIPFAMRIKKRATGLSSIGISITVGFLYYILEAVTLSLGTGGFLPPIIAASSSHIIVFFVSLHLISKIP